MDLRGLVFFVLAALATKFSSCHGYGRHELFPDVIRDDPLFASQTEEEKIVGGYQVQPGSLPYQVSVQRDNYFHNPFHFCGGSIINKYFVVTAAHCVDDETPSRLVVVAGEHELYKTEGKEQVRKVSAILYHRRFGSHLRNDIALLKLAKPLELSKEGHVEAISLPEHRVLFREGEFALVSGWGALRSGSGSLPKKLRAVSVPIRSDGFCQLAYGSKAMHAQTQICAGAEGIDSCQGDSGGPMVCKEGEGDEARNVLCGIVSWGRGCALKGYPGVYTEVSYYTRWIEHNVERVLRAECLDKEGDPIHGCTPSPAAQMEEEDSKEEEASNWDITKGIDYGMTEPIHDDKISHEVATGIRTESEPACINQTHHQNATDNQAANNGSELGTDVHSFAQFFAAVLETPDKEELSQGDQGGLLLKIFGGPQTATNKKTEEIRPLCNSGNVAEKIPLSEYFNVEQARHHPLMSIIDELKADLDEDTRAVLRHVVLNRIAALHLTEERISTVHHDLGPVFQPFFRPLVGLSEIEDQRNLCKTMIGHDIIFNKQIMDCHFAPDLENLLLSIIEDERANRAQCSLEKTSKKKMVAIINFFRFLSELIKADGKLGRIDEEVKRELFKGEVLNFDRS